MWPFDGDKRLVEAVESLAKSVPSLLTCVYRELSSVGDELANIRFSLSRPGVPTIVFSGENEMKKILFKVVLAPELDSTTVTRELSVKVSDDAPDFRSGGVDVIEHDGFKAPVDTPVHIEQVDIDNAGNRSKEAVLDTTVQDTFPPQQPGQPGVVAIGEIEE